jgi:hypothetical protein
MRAVSARQTPNALLSRAILAALPHAAKLPFPSGG